MTEKYPVTIPQRQLRNDNAAIMRRVEEGESFVITRNGEPVADLTPHGSPPPKRRMTLGELQEHRRATLPDFDAEALKRDLAEADELFSDTYLEF